jgi:hypothetical protein
MADANPSRIGQINQAGVDDALFLKQYSGMVLPAFDEKNIMSQLHLTKTVENQKSSQFPVFGKKIAKHHTAGVELLGEKMNHGEREIFIDDRLLSDSFIANIDELKNHYETMDEYAKQDAHALARHFDKNVMRKGFQGAAANATVTDGYGGLELANPAYATTALTLAAGIADACVNFDEKDVPEDERCAIVKPAQYQLLWQAKDLVNKDYSGNGSFAKGTIVEYDNCMILKSNNVPQENDSALTSIMASYRGNYSSNVALVFHKTALATLKLQGVKFEEEYQITRQGTFMVTSMAVGTDYLRPEALVALKTA